MAVVPPHVSQLNLADRLRIASKRFKGLVEPIPTITNKRRRTKTAYYEADSDEEYDISGDDIEVDLNDLDDELSESRIVVPSRRTRHVYPKRETSPPATESSSSSTPTELLAPIELNFVIEGYTIKDRFLWNVNDTSTSAPRQFVTLLLDDLNLPFAYIDQLTAELIGKIQEARQQANLWAIPSADEGRVLIKLDLFHDNIHVRDQFEWDLKSYNPLWSEEEGRKSGDVKKEEGGEGEEEEEEEEQVEEAPPMTPEVFARILVEDLKLPLDWVARIAFSIHEQLLKYRLALSTSSRVDSEMSLTEGLPSGLRPYYFNIPDVELRANPDAEISVKRLQEEYLYSWGPEVIVYRTREQVRQYMKVKRRAEVEEKKRNEREDRRTRRERRALGF